MTFECAQGPKQFWERSNGWEADLFRLRDRLVGLRLVLAPWWPAATFHERHPAGWAAPAPATASSEALQSDNCLFEVFAFRPQFGEHFGDVHSCRIPRLRWALFTLSSASVVTTEFCGTRKKTPSRPRQQTLGLKTTTSSLQELDLVRR
jgi:hypothetical protein